MIATCSESLINSRGVTVISVFCVTKEVGLRCCTSFAELLMDSEFRLQVEFVPESDTVWFVLVMRIVGYCGRLAGNRSGKIPSD